MNSNEKNEDLLNDIESNASDIYVLLSAIMAIHKKREAAFEAAEFVAIGLADEIKRGLQSQSFSMILGEANKVVVLLNSIKWKFGEGTDVSGLYGMALVRAVELVNDLECLEESA